MRKFPVLALLAVLLIPAAAEAKMLWVKQARAITARIAQAELKRDPDYPTYVHATAPVCKRNTPHRVTCDYTIVHSAKPNAIHKAPCKRRVIVQRDLAGRTSGRRLNLNCYLNDDPDYEI